MRRRAAARLRATAALAGIAMLLTGCAAAAPAVSGTAASSSATTAYRLAALRPTVARTGTAIAVQRVAAPPAGGFTWSVASIDPSSARIEIAWTDSPAVACGQANRVQVFESASAVVIAVQDTRVHAPVSCSAVGSTHRARVALQRPLGARALVVPLTARDIAGTQPDFRVTLTGSPDALPPPSCASDLTAVGMPGLAAALAPAQPTAALVCRTAPDAGGNDRTTSVALAGGAARALAARLDREAPAVGGATAGFGCDEPFGTRYTVVFTAPRLRVPVVADELVCGRLFNGAASAPITAAVRATLGDFFR